MKSIRYMFVILTVCLLLTSAGAGLGQAEMWYQDIYTLTIGNISYSSGAGYNPWSISTNDTFDWWIQFDADAINSAGSLMPSTEMGIPINGPTGGYYFKKADSQAQYLDPFDGYTSYLDPVNVSEPYFDEANSRLTLYYFGMAPADSGASTGVGTLSTDDYGGTLSFGEEGTVNFTEFQISLGTDNPDRSQVPIPGALVLFSSGLISLVAIKRRYGK